MSDSVYTNPEHQLLEDRLTEKLTEKLSLQLGGQMQAQMQIMMEYFDSKFNSLIEAFQVLTTICAKQSDMDEVKQDIKVIKTAVTATNHDVQDHEKRITRLETKHA
jgi:hypothetical protein